MTDPVGYSRPTEVTDGSSDYLLGHVLTCLLNVAWAKPDLDSSSALQLGQITTLLIVFVGTVFPCFLEEFFEGPDVLVKATPIFC